VALATEVIDAFPAWYDEAWRAGQRAKLGLAVASTTRTRLGAQADDAALADDWLALLQAQRVDFTLGWRRLADAAQGDAAPLLSLFADAAPVHGWLERWRQRLAAEGGDVASRASAMRRASPWIIPRNHGVEEALAAAVEFGELGPFEELLAALRRPFDEDPSLVRHA
jgi:uncharacterized protein YdiU (UPF0061 family)